MSSPQTDCIFCNISRRQVSASIIFDDRSVVAFLDVNPLAVGHLLIIPKTHVPQLIDLSADQAADMGRVLPMLGKALLKITGADGFNLLQNNGEVAGQVVPHLHFHLIPRSANDGLGYRWKAGAYEENQLDQLRLAFEHALELSPS